MQIFEFKTDYLNIDLTMFTTSRTDILIVLIKTFFY